MRMSLISNRPRLVATLALAVVSMAAATAVPAATQQKPKLPINIQSNQATFDQKNGKSVYEGAVKLTRGGLTLTGDKLVLTNTRQRGQLHAVLTGSPAQIAKKPDQAGSHTIDGHAQRLIFDNPDRTVTMRGEAFLKRADGNAVRGAKIIHNLDTDQSRALRGNKNNERVKVTLQPKDTSGNGNK